jgi:hypothetical protein
MRTGDTCQTCQFWGGGDQPGYSECKRHAPTVFTTLRTDLPGEPWHENVWPRTSNYDWCGDHEPRAPLAKA